MLNQLVDDLQSGRTTAQKLVAQALERIADPAGEGARAFLHVDPDLVRAQAAHADIMRAAGAAPRFAGIPVSIKDLFDIAGQPSRGGSRVLADAPPASADAIAVARLRAAGFIPIGRTNMTEFAFSGLGINPHFGTPANPWDRANARIPGGSSSGAAVSVSDGMAYAGLGTDTGGSCRIPAALCGLVGFKPTARRVPLGGVLPLSTALDSVGPIAASVADCAALDAVLANAPSLALPAIGVRGLRLLAPSNYVLDGVAPEVAAPFARALRLLADAGALITEAPLPVLDQLGQINALGGFPAAEAYAWHRGLIAERAELYDPQVLVRLRRGAGQQAADYIDLCAARAAAIAQMDAATAGYDALVMPTVPLPAPPIADLAAAEAYARVNLAMLRNPTIANFFDRCAISLPCHQRGAAPAGLMLVGATGADRALLGMAEGIAALIGPQEV